MSSVICVHFQSTSRALCNIGNILNLTTLLNILTHAKILVSTLACHEVTPMVKLLIISVT